MTANQYLSTEYKLRPIDQGTYEAQAKRVASLKRINPLEQVLQRVMSAEDSDMIRNMHRYADALHVIYEEKTGGAGFHALSLAVGIAALREANPDVPGISSWDWLEMIDREGELNDREDIDTLEKLTGVGMLEIRGVNEGYVDGYQEMYLTPELEPFLGFTGLGTLHAHDLMYFASLREEA